MLHQIYALSGSGLFCCSMFQELWRELECARARQVLQEIEIQKRG